MIENARRFTFRRAFNFLEFFKFNFVTVEFTDFGIHFHQVKNQWIADQMFPDCIGSLHEVTVQFHVFID